MGQQKGVNRLFSIGSRESTSRSTMSAPGAQGPVSAQAVWDPPPEFSSKGARFIKSVMSQGIQLKGL